MTDPHDNPRYVNVGNVSAKQPDDALLVLLEAEATEAMNYSREPGSNTEFWRGYAAGLQTARLHLLKRERDGLTDSGEAS